MIKISFRDKFADLPPALLKKKLEEKKQEEDEKFYPFTTAKEIYNLLLSKMGPNVEGWDLNWNGNWIDEITDIYPDKTLVDEDIFLIVSKNHELMFHDAQKGMYEFNINSKVKTLSIVRAK